MLGIVRRAIARRLWRRRRCLEPTPAPATYTVGGTVTGLSGPGLVLNSNFAGDLAISASGAFTFGTRLPVGSTFIVKVKSQPIAQGCQVANGMGTIVAANVVTVTVTCGSAYTIRGTVSGLVGSGLTLEICPVRGHGPGGGYQGPPPPPCHSGIQVGANGAFTLDPPAGYSGRVAVFITQEPSSPWQQCRISNASFSIPSANDTSVTVACTSFAYVTNAADNTLSAYSIDPTTGALAVIGTPIVAGTSPYATANLDFVPIYNINRYVFVGNEGSNDVSAFVVDNTTGALTAVPGSPFPAGIDPQAIPSWATVSSLRMPALTMFPPTPSMLLPVRSPRCRGRRLRSARTRPRLLPARVMDLSSLRTMGARTTFQHLLSTRP